MTSEEESISAEKTIELALLAIDTTFTTLLLYSILVRYPEGAVIASSIVFGMTQMLNFVESWSQLQLAKAKRDGSAVLVDELETSLRKTITLINLISGLCALELFKQGSPREAMVVACIAAVNELTKRIVYPALLKTRLGKPKEEPLSPDTPKEGHEEYIDLEK